MRNPVRAGAAWTLHSGQRQSGPRMLRLPKLDGRPSWDAGCLWNKGKIIGQKAPYRRTRNLGSVQLLLGHSKLESTVRYLRIEVDDALEISEQTEI